MGSCPKHGAAQLHTSNLGEAEAVARPGTLSRTTCDGISAIWVQKPVDQPIQVGFPASSV